MSRTGLPPLSRLTRYPVRDQLGWYRETFAPMWWRGFFFLPERKWGGEVETKNTVFRCAGPAGPVAVRLPGQAPAGGDERGNATAKRQRDRGSPGFRKL